MINLFSHYIPARSLVLAAMEATVLLIAAQIGISLEFAGSRAVVAGSGAALVSQAFAFAIGTVVIMWGMGLYQTELWNNTLRVVTAFAVVLGVVGLVSHLMPSPYAGRLALGGMTITLALASSLCLRAAFHRWQNLSAFKSR